MGNWGRDLRHALHRAGHDVFQARWNDPTLVVCEKVIVNWDSGTLPMDMPTPPGAVVFVHHTYRGIPNLDRPKAVLSPVRGAGEGWTYFPYPVPEVAGERAFQSRTVGCTTLRREGLDYLQQAAERTGWTVHPPDQWRDTPQEVDRLAGYAALALWYTDSPGRSLALATAIAAQRPLILSYPSRMFEYAEGSEEIYWVRYSNQDLSELEATFRQVDADLEAGTAKIPRGLLAWDWSRAIRTLEGLW